jgi:CRISPR-associated endonuclease/helicase Cas3
MAAYGFQRRLAADGLPDLLCVPTGAGKTLAAVLPWLYRRTAHPACPYSCPLIRCGT